AVVNAFAQQIGARELRVKLVELGKTIALLHRGDRRRGRCGSDFDHHLVRNQAALGCRRHAAAGAPRGKRDRRPGGARNGGGGRGGVRGGLVGGPVGPGVGFSCGGISGASGMVVPRRSIRLCGSGFWGVAVTGGPSGTKGGGGAESSRARSKGSSGGTERR